MMSRKRLKCLDLPIAPIPSLPLRAAAYLCISEAKPTSPQISTESQLKIIEAFLAHQPNLTLTSTYTDADNHNDQRQGFDQMIQSIEHSEIGCVIVTDLSILGRNLIEIGYYIESYFPRHNIRLISISDQLESADETSKQNSKFASDDYANQLRNQVALLQYAIEEINLQIERQRLLIKRLGSTVQKGLITTEENNEFRFAFESKKSELVKMRNQILEMILRTKSKQIFE